MMIKIMVVIFDIDGDYDDMLCCDQNVILSYAHMKRWESCCGVMLVDNISLILT